MIKLFIGDTNIVNVVQRVIFICIAMNILRKQTFAFKESEIVVFPDYVCQTGAYTFNVLSSFPIF